MEKIKVVFGKVRAFIKDNPEEALVLFFILCLGAFLRLYRISEYMTFLGDEGRDAIVVRRLLLYADPILVGPGTSIGNMYLGPLYYYFIAPFLFLFNYSPAGPSIGVALVGILTIYLVWHVSKSWFGKVAGLTAAFLYSISGTVIIYSRSSWNPNIMPFFSLLCIWSIWKIWDEKNYRWFIPLGISFAFAMQSHYLGLLLLPAVGLFWLFSFKKAKDSSNLKPFLRNTFFGAVLFAILMSPLVIFDARHEWRNFHAIRIFFTERQATVSARPWNAIPRMWPQIVKITTRLVTGKNEVAGQWFALLFFLPVLWLVGKGKKVNMKTHERKAYFLLFTWLLVALVGLSLYKQEIYDHYYGFFFAAPFIFFGGIAQSLVGVSRIRGTSIVIVALLVLSFLNFSDSPIKYPPNRQLQRTKEVAMKIIEFSEGAPFNLAVIAERNYDDAYEYFLRVENAKMLDIDPQKAEETTAAQLFVVCEMVYEKCDPTHNPKAEVANFGWSKIEKEWQVSGVVVFKLVHSK